MFGRNFRTARRGENHNPHVERTMSSTQSDPSRRGPLTLAHYHRLEEENRKLRSQKEDLESRLAASAECQSKFRLWAGCELEKPTDTQWIVTFYPQSHGKVCETFSVSFEKKESVWSLNHYNLPCSINNFSERVKEAHMNTDEKLFTFLRALQHEVNMFVWRREQINEAKSLVSPSLTINSSVSTTIVHLTFKLDDREGSNLCKAIAKLKYESHKYLPALHCEFIGGCEEDQIALKEQLSVLELLPLKEAIMSAFPTSTEISTNFNTNHLPGPSIPAEDRMSSISSISKHITPSPPGRKRTSSSGPVKGNDPQNVPTGSGREQVTAPPSRLETAYPLSPPHMDRRSLPHPNNRGWDRGRGSGRGSGRRYGRRSGRGSGGGYSREFQRGFERGRSFTS